MVTYKLTPTIRNKILNYKETISTIDFESGTNIYSCNCSNSEFIDKDHGHIITGDLRVVKNNKLRSLLTKGPNYRLPQTINYNKCQTEICLSVDNFSEDIINKYKLTENSMDDWKVHIKEQVANKITSLKAKHKYKPVKNILLDEDVKKALENLQQHYVIVTIDKASNNFAFVCKRFYVSKILTELGNNLQPNPTYNFCNVTPDEVIDDNVETSKKYGLVVADNKFKSLPLMYWMPKMHKNPVGFRFIIASKYCSTKLISKAVTKAFRLIYQQVEHFHDKSTFYSNYNNFWVVQNSLPVIKKLDRCNAKHNAKSITTFDFSTLYTKIPHKDLLEALFFIIDLVFKGVNKKIIDFSFHQAK